MKTKKNTTSWVEEAIEHEKNSFWLVKSQRLALKLLMHLKREKITQVELARRLGVKPQQINKIVKGGVNLTLETICKIERELKTEFLVIPEPVKWRDIEKNAYRAFGVNYIHFDVEGYEDDAESFDHIGYLRPSKRAKVINIRAASAKEDARISAVPNIGSEKFKSIKKIG